MNGDVFTWLQKQTIPALKEAKEFRETNYFMSTVKMKWVEMESGKIQH